MANRRPSLDQGGLELIEKGVEEHPHARLVVVDTFTRIGPRLGRGSACEEDSAALGPLQQMALRRGAAVLVLTHLRKQATDDPLEAINASMGFAGALDDEGKRQALCDLSPWVAVDPSWHESNYRRVMCAFEDRDGERGWWFDGDIDNEAAASGAASPSRPPPRTQAAHTTRARHSYAAKRPGALLPLLWTAADEEPRVAA